MIDLRKVRTVLAECDGLVSQLDGVELDESDALDSQSKGQARKKKAQTSTSLSLLADRLAMAEALVRNEYWFARDNLDPLDPTRSTSMISDGGTHPSG